MDLELRHQSKTLGANFAHMRFTTTMHVTNMIFQVSIKVKTFIALSAVKFFGVWSLSAFFLSI
jgi:NAD dependent epimerase/dehydratase family enzyme